MTETTPALLAAIERVRAASSPTLPLSVISTVDLRTVLDALPVANDPQPELPTEPGSKAIVWCGQNNVRYEAILVRVVMNWIDSRDMWVDLKSGRALGTPNRWERLVPERPQITREQITECADSSHSWGGTVDAILALVNGTDRD